MRRQHGPPSRTASAPLAASESAWAASTSSLALPAPARAVATSPAAHAVSADRSVRSATCLAVTTVPTELHPWVPIALFTASSWIRMSRRSDSVAAIPRVCRVASSHEPREATKSPARNSLRARWATASASLRAERVPGGTVGSSVAHAASNAVWAVATKARSWDAACGGDGGRCGAASTGATRGSGPPRERVLAVADRSGALDAPVAVGCSTPSGSVPGGRSAERGPDHGGESGRDPDDRPGTARTAIRGRDGRGRRRRRLDGRHARGRRRSGSVLIVSIPRASARTGPSAAAFANATQETKRSFGSLAKPRMTAATVPTGTSGATSASDRGASASLAAASWIGSVPPKGTRPDRASYTVIARAYWSYAGPIGTPSADSGAM